ncbi:uncharacterized protein [Primulina huaijiensis]|uniref:uncharacterized protein isoform X2 n=1 Tax=Primulina huaijiensis TaxID=1492673 RepID=UPI003CC7986C
MEDDRKENSPWLSVPQFGDWDQKGQLPDYSMDFSKIRERRKHNKRDPSRASLGNEENLISLNTRDLNKPHDDDNLDNHQNNSPTGTKYSNNMQEIDEESNLGYLLNLKSIMLHLDHLKAHVVSHGMQGVTFSAISNVLSSRPDSVDGMLAALSISWAL